MKSKKKLSIRRFAYYLLIASILTSCIVNGTFAKFTTEDAGGDGARVAKFGVVMNIAGDLFSNAYYNEAATDSNSQAAYDTTDTSISVKASSQYKTGTTPDNVVAPGTKSTKGLNITIKGTPETDFTITTNTTFETVFLKGGQSYGVMVKLNEDVIRKDNYDEFKANLYVESGTSYAKAGDTYDSNVTAYYQIEDVATLASNQNYMPIVYKIGDNVIMAKSVGATQNTAANFVNGLNNALISKNTGATTASVYSSAANSVTSDVYNTNATLDKDLYLTWEWPFDDNNTNNPYDTILGHLAAGNVDDFSKVVKSTDSGTTYTSVVDGTDYNLNIDVSITLTANQVD